MILYVLRYWPTLTETFTHDEIRAVAKVHAVEVAACDPRGDPHVTPLGVPVHARPHRWGWLPWLPALTLEVLRGGWARPRVLWLALLARKARRVHVPFAGDAAVWAREACQRAGVPYGVTVHAVDLFKPVPELKGVLRDAALVTTISVHNQARLAELGVRSELVRCGVRIGDGGGGDALVFVGRNVPKKGLDTLLAAAAEVEGPVRAITDAPAHPRVEILGLRPHAEVLEHVRGARAVVLPCRVAPDGDSDGIPVVLLEALAAGVPVITTAVSGIPEVVDEAVGWLVPPDDPAALAAAMRQALGDPAEARRRGARGPTRLRERGFADTDAHARMAALLV